MYRRFARPGWIVGHVLVLLAALVCLRLGLWQWHRTHEATGTIQNLGYTVLWPIFAGAFVWMWIRFLRLEVLKRAEEDAQVAAFAAELDAAARPGSGAPPGGDATGQSVVDRRRRRPEAIMAVAAVGDDEDDPEMAAYNRALAELAEKDRRAH